MAGIAASSLVLRIRRRLQQVLFCGGYAPDVGGQDGGSLYEPKWDR